MKAALLGCSTLLTLVNMLRPLYLLLLLSLPGLCPAQPDTDQRFAAFVYGGSNFAQIDGDYYFGYNKLGVRLGIGANILWSPKFYTSVGLGFNQSGARAGRSEKYERGGARIDLRLNNVEVPVLMHYRLGKKDEYTKKANHRLYRSSEIQFGLSLSRTTGVRFNREGLVTQLPRKENFVAVRDQYEKTDLHFIIGFAVQMGLRSSLYIQHGKSILGIYRPGDVGLEEVLPLFPYYLNLGARYVLY